MSGRRSAPIPSSRVRALNDRPVRRAGDFVLYWMTAYRRPRWNYSLQRAVDWSRELSKPLVVFEALRCDYTWASARFHRFVIEGMQANAAAFAGKVNYYPYVEPLPGVGRGLLAALAQQACVVITDDFPCFFHPRMVTGAAGRLRARIECVDSNGLLPLTAADRVYPTAFAFRRFLQRTLPAEVDEMPEAQPLRRMRTPPTATIAETVRRRWPAVSTDLLQGDRGAVNRLVAGLPIDHDVQAVEPYGGYRAAQDRLVAFVGEPLGRYNDMRNQPERSGTSGLSAYLHFGHISPHEMFHTLAESEAWHPGRLSSNTAGRRSGWWGMSASAEAFIDQFVTWRELGFNMCSRKPHYDRFESLPQWALRTLQDHEHDRRQHLYDLQQFECASTHDVLWNAAQRELVREGRMHNYLRMLWGKKILEWSRTPREALDVMIELNNKYALDGRDPNSYSGICWVLGRYDRAWGPEREVLGKVRYMSSANTARKLRVREYVQRHAPRAQPSLPLA